MMEKVARVAVLAVPLQKVLADGGGALAALATAATTTLAATTPALVASSLPAAAAPVAAPVAAATAATAPVGPIAAAPAATTATSAATASARSTRGTTTSSGALGGCRATFGCALGGHSCRRRAESSRSKCSSGAAAGTSAAAGTESAATAAAREAAANEVIHSPRCARTSHHTSPGAVASANLQRSGTLACSVERERAQHSHSAKWLTARALDARPSRESVVAWWRGAAWIGVCRVSP